MNDKDLFPPGVRHWVYKVSLFAAGLIPLLVVYHLLDQTQGTAWINFLGVLGGIGASGPALASAVLSRQQKSGTLDFTGSPAEQAVAAIQATVDQAGSAAAQLDKVREAVNAAQPGVSIGCGDNLR